MGPVESIGQSFRSTCIVSRLTRDGCSVDLAGVPEPRLLIDLDLPGSPLDDQSVRCDYLVFAGDGKRHFLVAPVEFKTKWREKTVKQLQAGADESDRHVPVALVATFRPVVALHRFSPKAARRRLRERVSFRGRVEPIRVVLCGERLGTVLRVWATTSK